MGLGVANLHDALRDFIASQTNARDVQVRGIRRLGGGAIQENHAVDVEINGGTHPGDHGLVLRADAPSRLAISLSRAQEFAVLRAAFDAGVTVPEPLWVCDDETVIGRLFYLMRRVPGNAIGRSVVRDAGPEQVREALVERLGEELARIHSITPPRPELEFLEAPYVSPALHRIHTYRRYLDDAYQSEPVLEWGLRWLERNAPENESVTLCHSDYRTGNYMVDAGRLTGILDWEFAAFSDPYEDIGWFCARCWRFGELGREAGGLGSREAFYRGYANVSGESVDPARVPYWEVMAAVRWAVIALQQAQRHLSGEQSSLELALTGRMVPEMAMDILQEVDRIERQHA